MVASPRLRRLGYTFSVDTGQVTLVRESTGEYYGQGQEVVLQEDVRYRLRNDTSECTLLLRLVVQLDVRTRNTGLGTGSDPFSAGPERLVSCGERTSIMRFYATGEDVEEAATLEPPFLLFVGHMVWEDRNAAPFDPQRQFGSGPIGWSVEQGEFHISGRSLESWPAIAEIKCKSAASVRIQPNAVNCFLQPGGTAEASVGVHHSVDASEGSVVLVAGLVSTAPREEHPSGADGGEEAQVGVGRNTYVSPTYGYALSWNPSWAVVNEQSEDGYDLLQLDRGTSTLYVEGFAGYGGDPVACRQDQIEWLNRESDVDQLEIATAKSNGNPLEGEEDGQAWAVYHFVRTEQDGNTADMFMYLACQTVVPGESVLVITWLIDRADYNDQRGALFALLDSLTLPDSS
jgi:hypothetical protein